MAAKRKQQKMLKMTKKLQKDLQDPKKSSIFAPEKPKVVLEECSATPCKVWKPKEAMSIREMLIRTERGQRIDVNTRFRADISCLSSGSKPAL